MQTRTYADLFSLIQALCGVVFASSETGRIKALINRRAQRAYRSSNYWTRFLKIGEERYLSSDPIAATAIVADSGYFIATVGDTDFTAIGSSANTVGEYFVATGAGTGTGTARPALGYVPYTETGKNGIDSFMRIFQQAPYFKTSVNEFDFTVTADGATPICGDLNPQTAFVTYKSQLTDTYGDRIDLNEVSAIPAEWFQYLAHGAYADYLRAEGQQEKAALADQEAEALLTEELIRLDENHTSGFVSNRIRTNANMQLRW
jgi:hypothetical protein